MAEEGKKSLVTKEMTLFKIRMYTDIPPNAVLVGHNIFTKNPKIYKKVFLHMPWFKSKFVTMENHNRDLKSAKYELGGADSGLEITSDVAVTYRVTPMDPNVKMGFVERWRSVLSKFSTKPASSIVKTALLTGATVVGGIIAWPLAIAIPAATATYISAFHQDEDWVKEQGAYKAAYESKAAMADLEQIIYEELRAFYASHSYDEIKGLKVDLRNPAFADLKVKLDLFAQQYGIEATKITIKTADLTPESNQILQRQKEAEMRATEIERQAQAQKAVHDRNKEYAEQLIAMGLTPEQIAHILEIETARGLNSNAIVNVGGGGSVQPMFSMPINQGRQGQVDGDDQNTPSQRRR